MKKMKKILLVLLTVILSLSLLACGGNSKSSDKSDENPKETYTETEEDTELESEVIDISEEMEETTPVETEESEIEESEQAETESTDDPAALTYSTNSLESAKEGNSGVFSYKQSGTNYDVYWIIDFDEGYAYYFTYGNENGTCERVQIESGTLNEYIVVTYHDGGDTWQYGLSFKRKNQPDRLIQQDTNGGEYEFSATNLKDALEIRDTMTIVDY
jgi:ABC-type glycerol-3-phosphate transport system substrate-binding protein